MVVFTCNNCGESLQKTKVAKHYEFHCRTAPFVSCVDCFKDFRGEEYVAHTKCITEAERYGGKDYVPKPGANKGERKQQEWINLVNNMLNSETSLTSAERNFLNSLSKYDNIPRKKAKFLNFIRSMGNKANQALIDSVWDKMQTAYKNSMQDTTTKQQNGKATEKVDDKKSEDAHQENNVVENQNNENIYKENQADGQQNKSNGLYDSHNNNSTKSIKKKKSKKRKISEAVPEQVEEETPKKKKNVLAQESDKDTLPSESQVAQCDNVIEKSTFDWKEAILNIVKSKEEISLKKLQKKVTSQYMKLCPDTVTQEKAFSKFNKKLKKVSEVVISDEKVRLA
ncbi:uncharacterized protein LOC100879590 [Megachile rotundata]|uniref:uncharacterized protein LOC100879590 n=1 Tax=Megachile rotundata TaxID=143995 RepID=UPI000258DC73|nr:PREDICTED: cell growth-regulating nucleolar protein [Megachile rotundata]